MSQSVSDTTRSASGLLALALCATLSASVALAQDSSWKPVQVAFGVATTRRTDGSLTRVRFEYRLELRSDDWF